jgi:5-methylcytosine-specific restriction protein A
MIARKRFCRYAGCAQTTTEGYCAKHRSARESARGSAAARGYDTVWRKYRRAYLAEHPLCRRCEQEGQLTAASIVDHIVPHRGDPVLFCEPTNHQPLCKPCHDTKTASHDGGFGRTPAAASNPH